MDAQEYETLLAQRRAQSAPLEGAHRVGRASVGQRGLEQYHRLLQNRRRWDAVSLDQLTAYARLWEARDGRPVRTPVAAVMARAARLARRRQVAARAWTRVARGAWLAATDVDGIGGERSDTVIIRVSSSTVMYDLGRRKSELERQLGRLVPGVRSIRFVVAGRPGLREAEGTEQA